MTIEHTKTDDKRDVAAYTLSAAARHVGMPSATLRQWVVGRSYSRRRRTAPTKRLIQAPAGSGLISFNNLVEAHVLRGLRPRETGGMAAVGNAIAHAETVLGVERLLLRDELRTSGQDALFAHLDESLALSRSAHMAMRRTLAAALDRIDRDEDGLPVRLHPLVPGRSPARKTIVIDPAISYGRPAVTGSGITTDTLVHRVDLDEDLEAIADDYRLDVAQVMDAVMYERAV